MARLNLDVGNTFVKDGEQLRIVEVLDGGHVRLEALSNGKETIEKRRVIEAKILSGELILIQRDQGQDPIVATPYDLMTTAQKETVERKQVYVEALDKAAQHSSVRAVIHHVIEDVAKGLGDEKPPSRSTLSEWYKRWWKSGKSLAALAPRYQGRGRKKVVMDAEVERLLYQIIDERYLVREQPTLDVVIRAHIIPDLTAENERRPAEERFTVPSRATIFRYVDKLDPYLVALRREGKQAADQKYRYVGPGVKVEAPLDLVLFDHTELDVQTIAPVEGFVARPTITVGLDLYSRVPWGIYVGFASPGYETVMLCLRHGISEKSQWLRRFPFIEGDYPIHGLPRQILLDNAMEFHSESLRDACKNLGIGITYHPVRTPHFKAAVERFFRSVNTSFLAGLKGRTFSNTIEKGDYDPVKNAVIPFADFQEAFFKWVVDVYARDFCRGIEDFPLKRWEAGVKKIPVDLPENMDNLHLLLSKVKRAKIQQSGLHIFNTRYQSHELHDLFKRIGKGQQVPVKVDPLNLGRVYVYDEEKSRYLTAVSIDEDMEGLGDWEYRLIRTEIIARRKAGEAEYSIGEHRRRIAEKLRAASSPGKRKSSKKKARMGEAQKRNNDKKGAGEAPSKQFDFPPKPLDEKRIRDLRRKIRREGWGNSDDGENQ